VRTVRYPLERDGAPRLEVSWSNGYRTIKVRVDDVVVARSDVADLRRGRTFEMPDGRPLAIMMERGVAIWVDGQPVPGTYADPLVRVKSAPIWVLSVGGFAVWRALYLAPERPWPAGTWVNVLFAISLCASALAMRRGSYLGHIVALFATFAWFCAAFPTVHIDTESGVNAETVLRVFAAVIYVSIAIFVVRKIGNGARAAKELSEERARGPNATTKT
jgi:hypothetical protein